MSDFTPSTQPPSSDHLSCPGDEQDGHKQDCRNHPQASVNVSPLDQRNENQHYQPQPYPSGQDDPCQQNYEKFPQGETPDFPPPSYEQSISSPKIHDEQVAQDRAPIDIDVSQSHHEDQRNRRLPPPSALFGVSSQPQISSQPPGSQDLSIHTQTAHHRRPPNKERTKKDRARLFREVELQGPPNVVVFGETGVGKSSLINMLSDGETAIVSDGPVGCTFESTPHVISINGTHYNMWDTAGLNEGHVGSVPADQALNHFNHLVGGLRNGVSLLVYCIRGSRFRDIIKFNYDLFVEIICQGEVPVVIVITGLENEERMERWWEENAVHFWNRGMKFNGHACITTSKGKNNRREKEYNESKHTSSALIIDQCPRKAWIVNPDRWCKEIENRIRDYLEDYHNRREQTRRLGAEREAEENTRSPGIGGFLSSLLHRLAMRGPDRRRKSTTQP